MKNKHYLWKELLKYEIGGEQFTSMIVILVCINLIFVTLGSGGLHYFDAIIGTFYNHFYPFCIEIVLFVNVFYTYRAFEKKTSIIIRLKSYKSFLKKLIVQVLLSNFILLGINFIILLTVVNFVSRLPFSMEIYQNYQISYLWYTLFFYVRIMIILSLLSIFVLLVYKLFGYKGAVLSLLLYFYTASFSAVVEGEQLDTLSSMKFHPTQYFYEHYYSSFSLEVVISFVYVMIWIGIIVVLYEITSMYMKKIGE